MQLGAEGVFVGSGIFKSGRSRAPGARDRRGDDALRRPGSRGGRFDRPRRRDGQHRDLEARLRAAALAARLVSVLTGRRRWSACSRSRAASRRTRRFCSVSAPRTREVRVPADLDGLDALVLPGGESTVMTLGIEREGLAEPLRALAAAGTPILGTCAGMIMLDRAHLGILDVLAERNAFGRQLHSFEADFEVDGVPGRSGPRDLHPRAMDRRARARGDGAGRGRRSPGRDPPGQHRSRSRSTRS